MLTKNQREVVDLALKGHNVYIGGQTGTGKSYLLLNVYDKLTRMGKNVSVTCTTGIACTHFPSRCHAMTIHSWSGMDDGRHESEEICSLLQHNPGYKSALKRIMTCDVLIVDEISMLSRRLFEQLSMICSLKNNEYLFGNIQLIFCGDFIQLPPVKNVLYNEDGQYCFQSELFSKVFSHKIFLNEVKRQDDLHFISMINEVSKGILSNDSTNLIKSLERLLPETSGIVKLFSTNELVDKFNRNCILKQEGELYEFQAEDEGDRSKLRKILAPPILWLKKDCPVILIRNLSNRLVNGLMGTVVSCDKDGPVVYFPSVEITTKLEKISFTVYSPSAKKNLASRVQIPIKLGYAMTIHKSQGMTLSRVEIDCQQIFLPGQLGVAIGRCTHMDGLRVINFKDEMCMPHSQEVTDFISTQTTFPQDDMHCCRYLLREELEMQLFEGDFGMDEELNEHAEDDDEEEIFDKNFDRIISMMSEHSTVQEDEVFQLPNGFGIEDILN